MIKYALFDLDGTVTDPGEGIVNSIIRALDKMNFKDYRREELTEFIGPPLLDSFRDFCGFSPEDCRQALKYYREYYAEKGIFENKVYDGIPEALERLKKLDYKIIMATSKPEPYALKILGHFGLSGYFDAVAGSDMSEARSRKDEVIAYAIERDGIIPENAVMIGDRSYDVIGANAEGIPSVGVLYGYGTREELINAGACWLAESPSHVADIFEALVYTRFIG